MSAGEQEPIVVYTRPGCGYSFMLRRALRKRDIEFTEINIWKDPDAASTVRSVANGNETVPTVHVAGQWLVNPRPSQVAELAGR